MLAFCFQQSLTGADKPINVHLIKDFGEDGVKIIVLWNESSPKGLAKPWAKGYPEENKAIEDQIETAIGKVGLKKNPSAEHYIQVYLTKIQIEGEKYQGLMTNFGRYFQFDGEDGKKYKTAGVAVLYQPIHKASFTQLVDGHMNQIIDLYRKANKK